LGHQNKQQIGYVFEERRSFSNSRKIGETLDKKSNKVRISRDKIIANVGSSTEVVARQIIDFVNH
jgi:hypothetical protein